MKQRKPLIASIALIVGLAVVVPAHAGLYFEQRVTSEGAGQGMEMNIKGWADSGKAKIIYESSNNPVMGEGDYLLTLDGGKTVYLVHPDEKTYSKFDMAEVMGTLTQLGEATGGMVNIDFKDPHSKLLAKEAGEKLLGHSTTHYKWESGYTMDMKVAFMNMSNRMDTITDAWVTKDVYDPGLYTWLRATTPTTGDPELDQVLTQNAKMVSGGLVLKMDQTTTTTDKKGKQKQSMTHFEVTKLSQQSVDDSMFVMPTGYTEKPLMPEMKEMQGNEAQQGNEQKDENSEGPMKKLKGLFGKKK